VKFSEAIQFDVSHLGRFLFAAKSHHPSKHFGSTLRNASGAGRRCERLESRGQIARRLFPWNKKIISRRAQIAPGPTTLPSLFTNAKHAPAQSVFLMMRRRQSSYKTARGPNRIGFFFVSGTSRPPQNTVVPGSSNFNENLRTFFFFLRHFGGNQCFVLVSSAPGHGEMWRGA